MVINNTRQDVALMREDPYPSDLNMSDPSKYRLLTMGQLVTKYTLKMVPPHGTIFHLVSLLVRFISTCVQGQLKNVYMGCGSVIYNVI